MLCPLDRSRQRDGKPTDRASAELIENGRRDKRCQVGIDNGDAGTAEACLNRFCYGQAVFYLFSDTFKNENVGVDRHPDGKNNTGYAWQSKSGAKERHSGEEYGDSEAEHDIGDEAGEPVVERHDEDNGGCFAVVYRRNDGGYGLIDDIG